MEKQRNWMGWLLLSVMVLITGIALVATTLASPAQPEMQTADPTLQQHEAILQGLFPGASDFERVDTDQQGFVYAVHQGGRVLGYGVQQQVSGYAGPIELIVGFRSNHTLSGISVGGAEFKETAGLGAKAKEPAFTDQFKDRAFPLALGEDIDAISGATVTSQAVVDGVNLAAQRLYATPGLMEENAPSTNKQTANASVIGYGGPVLVRLTLDETGAIDAVDIGGTRFAETEGVGSRVKEESFAQSFLDKKPPLKLNEDVDAISGATISSQAAVDAVNAAAEFLSQKEAPSDNN